METNAVFYPLVAIAYENGAGAERPAEAREVDVNRILREEAWVAEGSYIGWISPLAEAADFIVWPDVPSRVARWRIVRRHLLLSLRRQNPQTGVRKLLRFLRDTNTF